MASASEETGTAALANAKSPEEPEPKIPRALNVNEEGSQSTPKDAIVPRDAPPYWTCLAKEGTNVTKTEEFLAGKVKPGSHFNHFFDTDGKVSGWWHLVLDDEAKKAVESYEDTFYFTPGGKKAEFYRALPSVDSLRSSELSTIRRDTTDLSHPQSSRDFLKPPHLKHDSPEHDIALLRRSDQWEKQINADRALRMVSQYKGANLDNLNDFVHVKDPGKGTFVYVIDSGVRVACDNPDYEPEFHPPEGNSLKIKVLQTEESKRVHNEHDDDSPNGIHGTAVAARALGTKFGVAKKATLISVKMSLDFEDITNSFKLVLQDLKANPDHARQSVVVVARGWQEDGKKTYADVIKDDVFVNLHAGSLRQILGLGVPVVCAAGNYAEQQGRQDIDTLPMLFQDDATPLINVGAANYDGSRRAASQGGSQLTLYAPGQDVEVPQRIDFQSQLESGTSMAAPHVAGLIATYLAYDVKPWDDSKQGLDRVKAIRDYLVTDRSSWERQSGVRMIWNGAGKSEHDSAVATRIPGSRALSIVLQRAVVSGPSTTGPLGILNEWLLFEGPRGQPAGCRPEKDAWRERIDTKERTIDNAPWPKVSIKLSKLDGMECEYKNDGQSPGALWCKERIKPIRCYEDQAKKKSPFTCTQGSFGTERRPTAYCEW